MSHKRDFEDDGRTIADMSGLGDAHPEKWGSIRGEGAYRGAYRGADESASTGRPRENELHERRPWEDAPFTWKERFHYMGAALGAALLIAFAFLGGLAVVIWLITLYGR